MSNPAKVKAATQEADTEHEEEGVETTDDASPDEAEEAEGEATEEQVFEQAVNKAVNSMKQDAKGNWVLPAGLPPAVKVAANLEKRRRDTQGDYTKTKQENKRLAAEKATLLKKASGNLTLTLSQEQKDELDDLKFSDPEAWRKKMNAYEREAAERQSAELEKDLKQVSTSTLEQEELENRKQVLADFNREHPDFKIDDDILANDIPPRITKALETGAISFEAFLQEVHKYLKTGKVVKQTERTRGQPNLSKVPGGSSPDKNAVKEDAILSYANETY